MLFYLLCENGTILDGVGVFSQRRQDRNCTQCNFVYYGQTERSLKTRIVEHKKAVTSFDQNAKVAGHVHLFGHRKNFENVKVVGFESNYHERLFSKPGALLWARTLGTIISFFRKSTKASREHELHGHAN